jgi:hypothetical protein
MALILPIYDSYNNKVKGVGYGKRVKLDEIEIFAMHK